jgi:hypothetical protein
MALETAKGCAFTVFKSKGASLISTHYHSIRKSAALSRSEKWALNARCGAALMLLRAPFNM